MNVTNATTILSDTVYAFRHLYHKHQIAIQIKTNQK